MGKQKSSRRSSTVRKELLAIESEQRKLVEETYTKPIHPGTSEGLKEFQNWLGIFYRHVYRHEDELKRLLRQSAPVRQNYERLVVKGSKNNRGKNKGGGVIKLTHEDFFQRYLYRCDPQRVWNWEQTEQRRTSLLNESSSSLLDDSARVQVRQTLLDSTTSTAADEDDEDDNNLKLKDSEEEVGEEDSEGSKSQTTKTASPPADNESSMTTTSSMIAKTGDASSEEDKKKTPVSNTPKAALLSALLLVGFVLTSICILRYAPADTPLKTSICDSLSSDEMISIDLPWWSPQKLLSCQQPVLLEMNQKDTKDEGTTQKPIRPWSALTNPIRWKRRRTQNYYTNGGIRFEEDATSDHDDLLHQDATPRWSLLKWKSDQQDQMLQLAGGDEGGSSSSISLWSNLLQKVRGRGWKSNSWGETDSGDMIHEEQEISVTTEGGHSLMRSSSTTTDLTTSSATSPKKYIKTVVTEVKKTTIYTPVN